MEHYLNLFLLKYLERLHDFVKFNIKHEMNKNSSCKSEFLK